jgi:hypothetical protein
VDAQFLFQIAGGQALCALAEYLLRYAGTKVAVSLNGRIRRFYSARIFHSMIRLDVPTWDDPVVAAQIEELIPRGEYAVPWVAIMNLVHTGSTILRMFSQTAVLFGVLREQNDGLLLCLLSFASDATSFFSFTDGVLARGGSMYLWFGVCFRLVLRDFISLGRHHTRRRICQDGRS